MIPMFNEFWALYPRKVAKRDAEKAFNRLKPEEQISALKAISAHVEYWNLKETDKDFIPHPATWLNGARFEDELDLTPKKQPQMPWYANDEMTMKKGQEIGINPRAGESMSDYRNRIQRAMV
jgi:hypothetical protein